MSFLSNTIFIGLPVNISLFGDKDIPYILLYYIVNTFMFWTVGVHSIKKDSGLVDDKKLFDLKSSKSVLSPPLITFGISVLLILFNISLPKFLLDGFKYLGNLTTPISTLFIGMTQIAIVSKSYNVDYKYATVMGTLSNLASLIFILLYMLFIYILILKI